VSTGVRQEDSRYACLSGAFAGDGYSHRFLPGFRGDSQVRATLYKDLNVPLPGPTRVLIALTVDYRYLFLSCIAALVLCAIGVYFWSRPRRAAWLLTA